jgi:hypothetical protein
MQRVRLFLVLPLLFLLTLVVVYSWFGGKSGAAVAEQLSAPVAAAPVAAAPIAIELNDPEPFCRFGVNAIGNLNQLNLTPLRVGWYLNYRVQTNPDRPNGIDYMPILPLRNYPNVGTSDSQILAAVAANPGMEWFLGNEPDRPGLNLQDNLPPAAYAEAYHYYYHLIKNADPTARIVAGNIVQPTPVRLQYLDAILTHYYQQYGELMPVDIWGFHNFILNEVSCSWDPGNCWGAETPTGMNIPFGEILEIGDNDRFDLFEERIYRFRHWLANRGYRGTPVYLSEYGVLMPADYGFPPSRVNAFMNKSFDLILTAQDSYLGDPYDDYRLIQRLSWYSDVDTEFNGQLFDEVTNALTPIGLNFAAYTAAVTNKVDLYPARIWADAPLSAGEPVTVTAHVRIANSGNLQRPTDPIEVAFYSGHPDFGGTLLGIELVDPGLPGCGETAVASFTWPNRSPGTHHLYVKVDPNNLIGEINKNNNLAYYPILVPTERIFMPIVRHSHPLWP